MFVASVFAACSDDDKIGFDLPVDVSQEAIRFTPAPGGAVMHYSLPEDKEVFGIRVRYNSVWGETVVKDGSYLMIRFCWMVSRKCNRLCLHRFLISTGRWWKRNLWR